MRGMRRLVGMVALGVLVAAGVVMTPSPALAITDVDGDGLDDSVEDALASRFLPWVWFDDGENYGCAHPATT